MVSLVLYAMASTTVVLLVSRLQKAVQARETILDVMSHDLKSPLTNILLREQLFAQRVKTDRSTVTPASVADHVRKTSLQIDRMLAMIANFLDVSRLQQRGAQLNRTEIDLAQIIQAVADRLRPEIEQLGVALSLPPSEPCAGIWDALAVDRMVTNLLSNALKYSNGKPVDVSMGADVQTAWFMVVDHGAGIPPDEQRHLFGRFEKAAAVDGKKSGHGLGLWIVRELARAHGGEVTLESRVGSGTRVRVSLPRQ
jgi:signal transduction histidine kinase